MPKRLMLLALFATLAGLGWSLSIARSPSQTEKTSPLTVNNAQSNKAVQKAMPADRVDSTNGSQGMQAIAQAAATSKYLFVFFYRTENESTRAMRKVFDATMSKVADRVETIVIDTTDPAEKPIIAKFELDRAPMPLVLVLAPNGAITGGFPSPFDEATLLNAFASPCAEKCLKELQESKLVFLCIQNESTTSNEAALKGVRDFMADSRYAAASQLVILDPADAAEASFLNDLQIDPKTTEAVTAFLAPPGAAISIIQGATSKDELVASLEKASSGCCPGGSCGPNGCLPPQ